MADRRNRLAVRVRREQQRRLGTVIVPDVVVDLLEVPLALARVRVERDDGVGEQIVATSL